MQKESPDPLLQPDAADATPPTDPALGVSAASYQQRRQDGGSTATGCRINVSTRRRGPVTPPSSSR